MSPERRAGLLRAALLLGVAFALSWPAWLQPGQVVLGSPRTDTVKHVWTLFLGRQMLREQGALWGHTDLANFPQGMDIFVIEPLGALFVALLPISSVIVETNLLSVLNLVLLGLVTARLGDALAGGLVPGLVAALVVMGSSVTAFFFHVGVGELQHLFLLPLCLLLLARLVQDGRWGHALGLGLALGLTVACGFYLGLFAIVGVVVGSLGWLATGPGRLRLLSRLAVAAPLSVAVAWPVLLGFRSSWTGRADGEATGFGLFGSPPPPPIEDVWARLDLARLLWPVSDTFGANAPAYIGGQYLGPVLVGLAAWGLVRRPRLGVVLLLVSLAGIVLAMGTRPVWLGQEVALFGEGVLPYAWLRWLLNTVVASPHYPSRFLALTVVALGGLGALALAGEQRRAVQVAGVGLALLSVADVALRVEPGWPVQTSRPPPLGALATLADRDPGAVIDLGYYGDRDHDVRNRTGWYQVAHGLPTQAVAISRLDYQHPEGAAWVLATDLVWDLRQTWHEREGQLPRADYDADLALLRRDGFAWLVLFGGAPSLDGVPTAEQASPPRGPATALTNLLGPPDFTEETLAVWHIPPVEVEAAALEAAAATRAARLEEARGAVFFAPP